MADTKHIDTFSTSPKPISLFRKNYALTDIRCLPFVRDRQRNSLKRRREFWVCPKSRGYNADCETGHRFAAAYLIYSREQSYCPALLGWIVRDMAGEFNGFAVGFMLHIERYAVSCSRTMGIDQIEADVEKFINRERDVMAGRSTKKPLKV